MGYAFGVGREAPAFNRTAADGTTVDLSMFRGDWYPILVFLPGSCRQDDDRLHRLDAAAGRLWGLRGQLLGACPASAEADAPSGHRLVPSFPIMMDDGSLAGAYDVRTAGVGYVPTAFIIDRAGKIVWSGEGSLALDPAVLERALRDVVR